MTTKLNLEFYSGEDKYSDGDVEDEILEIVKQTSDFTGVLQSSDNWAVMYHLTPVRRSLLEWYEFDKNKTLLEIGGGCGAFSGMFARKLKEVKVVELSRRRSEIIYNRHKDHDNLEIIVGNLNDITFEGKFDYITLIGVLEYAGKFTSGDTPYKSFLEKIKEHLNPGGKVIIAIENKFGLKYWAGAHEDHTGRMFDSIEDYPKFDGVRTFGQHELNELIKSSGFKNIEYFYPMPDYKLPEVIYSDDFLPEITNNANYAYPNFDQERSILFNESLAYQNIIKNKMFPFFANSFLTFVS